MTALLPERWQRIKSIFDEALEIPLDARSAWLDSATSEDPLLHSQVSELLAHYEADEGFLDSPSPESGLRFGVYRTVRSLGRGGMGLVYLGQRDDGQFERLVAIKEMSWLATLGLSKERFLAERRLLALLEHSHIARIYDAGMSESGTPYFVMEYVEGNSLNEYCRTHDCDRGARLELFRQLCSAVAFAHSKGIVHGDLKPANVMVSVSGQVKLLDFGVANYTDSDAGLDASPLTPAYSSPERLEGARLNAPADVFSLGIMLRELMTESNHGPKQGPILQTLIPPTGDRNLDSVIARATARVPDARYSSGAELLRDVEWLQSGRALKARPTRWVFSLAVLLLLLAAVVYWQWSQSQVRQASAAGLSRAALFQYKIQDLPAKSSARQALRNEALQAMQVALALDSKEESLRRPLGSAYRRLAELSLDYPAMEFGSATDALAHFNTARRLVEVAQRDDSDRLELAGIQAGLGFALFSSGQKDEAEKILRKAVAGMEALSRSTPGRDRELASALQRLGSVLGEGQGTAIPILERSLALRRALNSGAEDEVALVACLDEVSRAEMREPGGRAPARAYAIQAVKHARIGHDRYPESFVHRLSLASALSRLAEIDSVIELAAEAVVLVETLYAQDPANASVGSLLGGSYFVLGEIQQAAKDFSGARRNFEKSYQIASQLQRLDSANTQYIQDAAMAKTYAGSAAIALGRHVQGRAEIGRALEIYESLPTEARTSIGWLSSYGIALGHLARSYAHAGDHAEAAVVFERLLANHEQILGKNPEGASWRLAAAIKYAEAAHSRMEWARAVTSPQERAALLSQAQAWNQHALNIFFDLEAKKQIDPRWVPYLDAARRDRQMLKR